MVSAADSDMTDAEIHAIGDEVQGLNVFRDYDIDQLPKAAAECAELLQVEDDLEVLVERIKQGLPEKLYETAYALACDVAVADGKLSQEELRLLQIIRNRLGLERLHSDAIERGARARHARL